MSKNYDTIVKFTISPIRETKFMSFSVMMNGAREKFD